MGSELFDFKITSNPSQRVSTGLNISQTIHIYNHIIQTYPRHFCVTASHSWKKQFKRSCIESLSLSLYTRILIDLVKWCSYFHFSFHPVRTLEQGKYIR